MSKKKKGAIAGVAAAVVIVCAAGAGNATYTINEQEQAVVTTFGVSHAVTDPGLHFKIPFVQHVTTVSYTHLDVYKRQDMYSLAVCMWCLAIPLAAAGTYFFHWPVVLVYACTCIDEVGKLPWVLHHFRKYKWVKDLTH